jgi:hypothetical protein
MPSLEDQVFSFLDGLHETGFTMSNAVPYIMEAFGISRGDARDLLAKWMTEYEKGTEDD